VVRVLVEMLEPYKGRVYDPWRAEAAARSTMRENPGADSGASRSDTNTRFRHGFGANANQLAVKASVKRSCFGVLPVQRLKA